MTFYLKQLEVLKANRRKLVESFTAVGHLEANVEKLATIQSAISAFEAVAAEDADEEFARRLEEAHECLMEESHNAIYDAFVRAGTGA